MFQYPDLIIFIAPTDLKEINPFWRIRDFFVELGGKVFCVFP